MEDVPCRKQNRLQGIDYSKAGYYFLTICTLNRRKILGRVVGGDALIAPSVLLSKYGEITEKYIENIKLRYECAHVDKYVIMPNHIHMILMLDNDVMRVSLPENKTIPGIIRSLKILVTKEAGISILQRGYYDHIIRDEADYLTKCRYIDNNPARWMDDEYYVN